MLKIVDLYIYKGVRDSFRYMGLNDWHRDGSLSSLSFVKQTASTVDSDCGEERTSSLMLATHNLLGDVHNVRAVLLGLQTQMTVHK